MAGYYIYQKALSYGNTMRNFRIRLFLFLDHKMYGLIPLGLDLW